MSGTGQNLDRYRALFEPKGIIVAGASSHPGKFGFVAAHNILAHGYRGKVFLTNREGGTILDEQTYSDLEYDEAVDSWRQASVRDRIEWFIQPANDRGASISIFAARRDSPPEDDDGIFHDIIRA